MKHFEIKNTLAGAKGGASKPKPATLKPPKIGDYSVAASFSYSETVDLLSDGPIEGLSNSNSYVLNPTSYLQGVYLNDVPVEQTSEAFIERSQENITTLIGSGQSAESFTGAISQAFGTVSDFSYNEIIVPKNLRMRYVYSDRSIIWNSSNPSSRDRVYGANNIPSERYRAFSDIRNLFSPIADYTLISQNFYGQGTTNNRWRDTMFGCIDLEPAFSGQVVSYGTNEVYGGLHTSINEGLYRYQERRIRQNYLEAGSSSNFSIYAKQTREFWFADGDKYKINASAQALSDAKKVAGGTCFFTKQSTEEGGANTFYTEICLQVSEWEESINSANPLGIFRKEISDSINQLVDTVNVQDDSRSSGKLSSEFLRERLKALGFNLNATPIENNEVIYEQITRNDITDLVKTKLKTDQPGLDVINPYLFVNHDEGYAIDGYIESEHKDIFKTETFVDTVEYGKQYNSQDLFFYGDVYYICTASVLTSPASAAVQDIGAWITQQLALATPTIATTGKPGDQLDYSLSIEPVSTEIRSQSSGKVINLIIPKLDSNGNWNGQVWGFNIESFNLSIGIGGALRVNDDGKYKKTRDGYFLQSLMPSKEINYLKNITGLGVFSFGYRSNSLGAKKYNYSNVMMEFRNGQQFQEPLDYFKNIYIDKFYNSELLGPFNTRGALKPDLFGILDSDYYGVQKIKANGTLKKLELGGDKIPDLNFPLDPNTDNYLLNSIPEMDESYLAAIEEGSKDIRQNTKSFSDWNTSKVDYDERAQPVTHIIENPNVSSCFVTLSLKSLSDTVDKEGILSLGAGNGNADIGTKIPAPLNIRIETGLIDENGGETILVEKFFQIIALVEAPNYLDIGNPDAKDSIGEYDDVKEINQTLEGIAQGGISQPFILPPIPYNDIEEDTAGREDKKEKRYIKITKLSTESNSTLISKVISLVKVTEIIESQCSYPFSAIVGTKIDSRVFNDIPKRTYRGKFKKVKIPSNYFPIDGDGKDKRYFKKESEFNSQTKSSSLLYNGDWNGSFKFEWTDNPAWILYDMIVATRYGLGQQISESEVNKWDLYKIGRFCDAVDEDGYFLGVKDGRGGIEPRFTCNIAFTQGTKIFDAINSIAAIFRGIVYFQNSTISFLDDRLKSPIALFTNASVKDGFFSYSSYKRDEKYNAVEVAYLDRNDSFKSKIEYIENEKDIVDRGLFKKEITAAGITSKAMARRAAKHLMYQTTKENETVAFTAGNEVLLCKPGDLIIIEDDLKTLRHNIGRVLSVDADNLTIKTSEPFKTSEYEKRITVYLPTGNKQKSDLDEEAQLKRLRLKDFEIEQGALSYPDFDVNFIGDYGFNSYSQGYSDISNGDVEIDNEAELYEQYAVYTGSQNQIIWFNTGVTGWVFSTGKAFTDDDNYNLFINSTGQGTFNFKSLTLGDAYSSSGFVYDSAEGDKRAKPASFNLEGKFTYQSNADLNYFGGLQESDINVNGYQQIRDFNVTGWGGFKGIQANEYGDTVYIDENDPSANLLKFVPEGSTYRFPSKDASDQVYKIISIMEDENYSYKVIASKYLSGKYEEIENDINIPEAENTFGYNKNEFNVNEISYISLEAPTITLDVLDYVLDESPTIITGSWEPVENATGYYYYLELPNGQKSEVATTPVTNFSYTPDLIGNYTIRAQSLADTFNNADYNKRYDDSSPASESIYVSGQDLENLDGSVVVGVVIE